MSEFNENMEVTINGEDMTLTRRNTTLFKYIGDLACYDHIFVVQTEPNEVTGEDVDYGYYVFKSSEGYADIHDHIVHYNYPQHLFLNDISETDLGVFNDYHYKDLSDTLPDDW